MNRSWPRAYGRHRGTYKTISLYEWDGSEDFVEETEIPQITDRGLLVYNGLADTTSAEISAILSWDSGHIAHM